MKRERQSDEPAARRTSDIIPAPISGSGRVNGREERVASSTANVSEPDATKCLVQNLNRPDL